MVCAHDIYKINFIVYNECSRLKKDSAYTERYMGKPNVSDNYKGYADTDVTKNVEPLSSKMFFLAHGKIFIKHI